MLFALASYAQVKLETRISASEFSPGDTILFSSQAKGLKSKYSTLHLIVEEVTHQRYWKLRYPMLDGLTTAALILPDTFPKGVYAFNFQLQGPGLHIMGQVLNEPPPAQVNVLGKASNKEVMAQTIKVEDLGFFQMPGILFEDKATFVFSPVNTTKENNLEISIWTPIDSAFVSLADTTIFVPIGADTGAMRRGDYAFNAMQVGMPEGTLQNVTVTGKKKTPAEQYMEKYVHGFFDGNGMVFDGLAEENFGTYGSVAEILNGRVPGMSVMLDRVYVESAISVRGFEPAFFVDEMETDYQGILAVPTGEIAMIKVFRPPFMGTAMGSAGGAIAIYTKRGENGKRAGLRNRFVVNGYTPQEFVLQ